MSYVKTATLAAFLALGGAAAAQAATTTTTYTFGKYSLTPVSLTFAKDTNFTFSVLSGAGAVGIADGLTPIFGGIVNSSSPAFSYDFGAGSTLNALIGTAWKSLTVQVTLTELEDNQTPDVPVPASLPLLAGALGLAGAMLRRRRAA